MKDIQDIYAEQVSESSDEEFGELLRKHLSAVALDKLYEIVADCMAEKKLEEGFPDD